MSNNILLIGPPNVGKSVFFNRLTGLDVAMANYAGTTIEYKKGTLKLAERQVDLIDAPGTYTLDATNEAEEVAVELLAEKPDVVVCVMDANNLESSLYLLLQILEKNLPTIVALNRVDLLEEKESEINIGYLEGKLGVPIIPTVATKGRGVEEVKKLLAEYITTEQKEDKIANIKADWKVAEELTQATLSKTKESNNLLFREKLGKWLIKPWPGLLLAVIILSLVFAVVVGVGMGVRQYILLPFFRNLIFPVIINVVEGLVPAGIFRNILIGEYGFLIKGLEWPFALVLPYVISFYTALSVLEDSGYLPRLGILLDGFLTKIGLSGSNIIPLLLGYGCAIPGITATRALASRKERIMVSTMICLAIPCISQTGAFISLLAEESLLIVAGLFLLSIFILIIAGLILDFFLGQPKEPFIIEVPELLLPEFAMLSKKVWIRIKSYLFDGAIAMFYAIALAALLYELGVLVAIGRLLEPIVSGWLRLPSEAAVPLILGIVRRELAVLPLLELDLTTLQLFVGAVVALFYVPCIAVLAILGREFKVSIAVGVLLLTTSTSFLLGGLIMRLGTLIAL